MQFTRIRLNGFKSFVDPTELVISTGLTGVVGPNGCGKSNLLEALRWIMGENRPTQMRGEGMDDVIFAGTDKRPARNAATVELVIDNSDRLAPAQFNVEDKLEVSRRITREIGSAYRINGKDVRARDVQMLFADASTGAGSPALVRQGQIGQLISAKPKARRRILEEAAGISGLYQRRHEAELKLRGTETNLQRLEDVLDQLSQQLTVLERQAGQARRYRRIADDLRRAETMLLYLRWRVAEDERLAAEIKQTDGTRSAATAEAAVVAAATEREAAEEAMPALREEETVASAVAQRLAIERDQLAEREERASAEIAALDGRLRQIAADLQREETLNRDAGATLERLASEASEIEQAQSGQTELEAEAADGARVASDTLAQSEDKLDRLTEDAARIAARTSAAQHRITEAEAALERIRAQIADTEASAAGLTAEITETETSLAECANASTAASTAAEAAEAQLKASETARADAQAAEGTLRADRSDAEGAATALSAEVDALARLLERGTGEGTRLIDRVDVSPGYEVALGAALGEDLNFDACDGEVSGWRALDPFDPAAPLPAGVEALSKHAVGPAPLARRFSQTGIVDAADGDALQPMLLPGQRIVSREGDLWRWDGLKLHAGDASSSAALRLQQRNRLTALQSSLSEAEARRSEATRVHEAAQQTLERATADEHAARVARREADQQQAEAARALSRTEAALDLCKGRLATQSDMLQSRRREADDAAMAVETARAELAEAGDLAHARAAVEAQRAELDQARTDMMAARARLEETRRAVHARETRLGEIARERGLWQDRLDNAETRIADLAQRRDETEDRLGRARAKPGQLAEKRTALADQIEAADVRRKTASDALAVGETNLRTAIEAEREAERTASMRREDRARLGAVLEAAAARAAEASEAIAAVHDGAPETLLETLEIDAARLPGLAEVETDVARLTRQRDSLGAVNLRADEDAEALRAERDQLAEEKADLDAAIAKLRRGIAELNREGRERLLTAFETVNQRFASLFRHLFGGGEARLVMVESEDPLDAGLEILCQPPGKKLSSLSLLSGGEQTLTALSLIFAVFLSNPSPICVLDEVDAPLDDSNVTRFCDLLDEMRRLTETRFLIITHHAITMSRMDRLFGVTMVERGVSQLVSVDLTRAAEMVDA